MSKTETTDRDYVAEIECEVEGPRGISSLAVRAEINRRLAQAEKDAEQIRLMKFRKTRRV